MKIVSAIVNVFFFVFSASSLATNYSNDEWRFKVFLDDKEIGFHHFTVVNNAQQQSVYSTARFDVKFLFINAYSYAHDNVEQWNDQCLSSINAVTNDNGETYKVSGKSDDSGFIVNTVDEQNKYASCIKTFAYWNPDFLNETVLLNSQTGQMIKVQSEYIGEEMLLSNGNNIKAKRYRLSGDNLQIDLWYSNDNHWLALESLTDSGRIVRYTMK